MDAREERGAQPGDVEGNGAGPGEDLAERADDLLRHARALRQDCERLGERLEEIALSAPGRGSLRPPEPGEGIRVVATNLALSGKPREEVDARLKEAFGMADNDSLLDEVFTAISRSGSVRARRLGKKR